VTPFLNASNVLKVRIREFYVCLERTSKHKLSTTANKTLGFKAQQEKILIFCEKSRTLEKLRGTPAFEQVLQQD
jgi:hypothetical protein